MTRIGLLISQHEITVAQALADARAADAAGLDIWVAGQLLALSRQRDKPTLEPLTLLAAIATVTQRARLGRMVYPAAYLPPFVLAKTMITLDQLLRGRLEIGLGAGWLEEEFLQALGSPMPPGAERRAALDRTIDAITTLADDADWDTGDGHRVRSGPPAVNDLTHVWPVAGQGPKILELVGRRADWANFARGISIDDFTAAAATSARRASLAAGRGADASPAFVDRHLPGRRRRRRRRSASPHAGSGTGRIRRLPRSAEGRQRLRRDTGRHCRSAPAVRSGGLRGLRPMVTRTARPVRRSGPGRRPGLVGGAAGLEIEARGETLTSRLGQWSPASRHHARETSTRTASGSVHLHDAQGPQGARRQGHPRRRDAVVPARRQDRRRRPERRRQVDRAARSWPGSTTRPTATRDCAAGYTVGMLQQEPPLDETKTVRENVEDGVAETARLCWPASKRSRPRWASPTPTSTRCWPSRAS